ncbi:MAG: ChaN family lipoprotein, partial [Bacteroidota bacterium]
GKNYFIQQDFLITPYTADGQIKGKLIKTGCGINAPSLNINEFKNIPDIKGNIAAIDISLTKELKVDSLKLAPYLGLRARIDAAVEKGAVAVVFYFSDKKDDPGKFKKSDWAKITSCKIPVLILNEKIINEIDANKTLVEINVNIKRVEKNGNNVVAFLDNGAKNTIIVGAHMDHLGFGEEESSLYKGSPAIHNGADDNASGTAGVIELARIIKKSELKNNNFLFLCFSGEEKGLLGSAHFTKNPTIDLANVNYMINMDMIGRLKADEKILNVYGSGTSPEWKELIEKSKIDGLNLKLTESGIGPSDHTSFYLKDIPVLHFFSGFHSDYHKPTDDADKINYDGEAAILNYIFKIINETNNLNKLTFTKTKDESVSSKNSVGRPKTTLGIIPDYNSSGGEGLKIDGVSEGKPAEHAGLKAGDIITQIGDYKISDMQSYMSTLANFSKEDKTTVKIKRETEVLTLPVDFSISPETKKYDSKLSEKNYKIFSVKENKEVNIDNIVNEMKNYDVLFYGEEHNDSVTHFLEKSIYEKLYASFGEKLSLSMEMFDRDVQDVMDEYLNGIIKEKHLKKDARAWSNYRDYKPMVEFSKEKKLNVICANAPTRYTNLAGREGQKALEKVSKESKKYFAPLPYDTASGKYYEKLTGTMSGHSASDTAKVKMPVMNMGGFSLVTAQSLWDATKAYSI